MMTRTSSNLIGFVPTLEVLPLVAELSGNSGWTMIPCPSYGRVIRQLLAGKIVSGLLPFEVFLVEILSRPALLDRWCVPVVMPASPVELILSQRMMKQIHHESPARSPSSIKSIVIGIESRNSLTRHQFIAWLQSHPELQSAKPVFKMLPMELMQKAMHADTIDGFIAPAPWGLAVHGNGDCKMVNDFSAGKLAQQLVLCSHRQAADESLAAWSSLTEKLSQRRQVLHSSPSEFNRAVNRMAALGRPCCENASMSKAADLYQSNTFKNDFIPGHAWLHRQIDRLSRLIPVVARSGEAATLAEGLALNASLNHAAQEEEPADSGSTIDTRLLKTSADQPISVFPER